MASLPPPRNGTDSRSADTKAAAKAFQEFRARMNSRDVRDLFAAQVPQEFRTVDYVDRLIESIYVAVRANPKLLTECSFASLLRSAEQVAKRALIVGDNIAWLVPYKNKNTGKKEVQYQLGYMGAVTLIMRSGNVTKVNCQPVFENDMCEIHLGTEGKIIHRPYLKGSRGSFIGAYSMIWLNGSIDPSIEWMDVETVEFIRENSPGKNSEAWRLWYSEMGRSKCLKRHTKSIPKERPVDLTDMDDRMGETIDGIAEPLPAALSSPTEGAMPMDQFEDDDDDDREPEPAQREAREETRQQQRQAQPDHDPRDDEGGPGDIAADEPSQPRGQVPSPRGGPRRGSTGGLFQSGG